MIIIKKQQLMSNLGYTTFYINVKLYQESQILIKK